MKYKYLFIDADNTIFDYSKAERESLHKSLRESILQSGISCMPETALSKYREINSSLWKELENGTVSIDFLRVERFRRLFKSCGINSFDDETCRNISEVYLDHLGNSGHMLEGALEILETLGKSCTFSLITNGIGTVQRSRLKAAGIEKYFRSIIISEEIGFKKPEKNFFDEAVKRSGNPPADKILVIGDSLSSDIKGGVNYGLDTCWFNPGRDENITGIIPRYEISSLNELYKITEG